MTKKMKVKEINSMRLFSIHYSIKGQNENILRVNILSEDKDDAVKSLATRIGKSIYINQISDSGELHLITPNVLRSDKIQKEYKKLNLIIRNPGGRPKKG